GWLLHRTWGGIVAGAFFVIPSIFVLMGLTYVYAAHGHVPAVVAVLAGCKPVVVAIVVEAVLKIGARALKRRVHALIAAIAFLAIYFLHVPFPLIVLPAALIDDNAPRPPHTRPSARRAMRTLAVGVALWLVPFVVLAATRGWNSLH